MSMNIVHGFAGVVKSSPATGAKHGVVHVAIRRKILEAGQHIRKRF